MAAAEAGTPPAQLAAGDLPRRAPPGRSLSAHSCRHQGDTDAGRRQRADAAGPDLGHRELRVVAAVRSVGRCPAAAGRRAYGIDAYVVDRYRIDSYGVDGANRTVSRHREVLAN